MYRNLKTNEIIGHDDPFTDENGTKYPGGWLRQLTDADALKLGLEKLEPVAVPEPARDYAAELKELRNQAMSRGVTVMGALIHTDDVSQGRITAAALAVTLDPNLTIRWKTAEGRFLELNATQILFIAQAVRTHVQACFDHEAELLGKLEEAADQSSVDLLSGWPGGAL